MSSYQSDEYLMLSGIQHFAFCKRQWALIHIEQVWVENVLTISGQLMHKNVDDEFFTELRDNILTSRSVPLISHSLKISGVADVVEYHRSKTGIKIDNRDGFWTIIPVEYKHGKKKADDCDEVQLCAQAICLEEMHSTKVTFGYLFYAKTRRRVKVVFSEALRNRVRSIVAEMYSVYESKQTPLAEYNTCCKSCSLVNSCLPKVLSKSKSVDNYLSNIINEYKQ